MDLRPTPQLSEVPTMTQTMKLVGLDVHAQQTHAGVLDRSSGELWTRKLKTAPVGVVDFLETLGPRLIAVYEAGPSGFALARAAAERDLDVRVCAPGLIPKKPSDRVKTDRRDAERLARLLVAGELSFVRIPSLAEEQLRDLVRAREDVRGDLMRARHRLSKFLARRGLRYPGPGSAWTHQHARWLGKLCFDDVASKVTFVDYVASVGALVQRRTTLDVTLEELAPSSPWADTIARLRCFRGIDTLTAIGLCAEIGDFGRFAKPAKLGSFLGLVPSEHTSDTKRRQGAITKAGPSHSRRLLVEAAQHGRRKPAVRGALARRQAGQDPRVCEVAWRAQGRLHTQWQKLNGTRNKHSGVAAVACARELANFVWQAATLD